MKQRKEDVYVNKLFNIGYNEVMAIDIKNLPIKPTRCVDCFDLYIRTQGRDQETCLKCQREQDSKPYEQKLQADKPRKHRVLGKNKDTFIVEWGEVIEEETFDGIYFP